MIDLEDLTADELAQLEAFIKDLKAQREVKLSA